jgi:hypothetical protein
MFADGGQVMGISSFAMDQPLMDALPSQNPYARIPNNLSQLNLYSQIGAQSMAAGAAPLQQYGQYLEQQYGEPDFAQKRDQFLQEVSQKEQQTFQDDTPMPLDQDNRNLGDLMGGGPQPFYNSQLGEIMFTNRAFDVAPLNPSMGPDSGEYDFLRGLPGSAGLDLDGPYNPLKAGPYSGSSVPLPEPPMMQLFADGGPVYMSDGGIGSIRPQERPQDFKVDERVDEKNEARASLMETIYDLESNTDYNKWNLKARNKPKTPLTSMTVREIMNYQKDDDGPAAGAGQIKHDTLEYLIDNGYISSSDVFSPEVQDKAVIRLLDRRGFVSWFNGETPTEEFGSDMAKEFASLPLLEARIVKGKARDRGQSRYANNTALLGADSWQDVLESSINIPQNSGKGESVPSYFLNEGIAPDTSLRPIGRPLSIETPSYQEIRPQSRPESLYPAMDQGVEAALMEALQGQNLEEKYSVENMEQQLAAPQMRPQMRPETLGIMSAIR